MCWGEPDFLFSVVYLDFFIHLCVNRWKSMMEKALDLSEFTTPFWELRYKTSICCINSRTKIWKSESGPVVSLSPAGGIIFWTQCSCGRRQQWWVRRRLFWTLSDIRAVYITISLSVWLNAVWMMCWLERRFSWTEWRSSYRREDRYEHWKAFSLVCFFSAVICIWWHRSVQTHSKSPLRTKQEQWRQIWFVFMT